MMIWFAMAVPIGTAVVLYFWFHHKTLWWEFLIPFGVSVLLITICKFSTDTLQTMDTEYWTGWMVKAEYVEDWNERVSCRHPEYETDKDGNSHFVGYEHAYDVDYHPPYWEVHDSNGITIGVNSSTFERLCGHFGNRTFVELHRSYHTDDGDKYVTTWKGEEEKLVVVTTDHRYENRVQASQSLFNFQDVDPADKEAYNLFDYPDITGYSLPSILGNGGATHAQAERILSLANARLGQRKQVRMWVLIFHNQPLQAGFLQQNLWKGGNKNEFVLTIGVDREGKVDWCHPFSWSEVEDLKVDARNAVLDQKGQPLDLARVVNWMIPEVDKRFIRKSFAEFSYITIDPPGWMIILTFLLTIAVNVGLSFYIVKNEYHEGQNESRSRRSW